jgi:hypothetical protein
VLRTGDELDLLYLFRTSGYWTEARFGSLQLYDIIVDRNMYGCGMGCLPRLYVMLTELC